MELVQQPGGDLQDLDPLGGLIGPLFGILIADYYLIYCLIREQIIIVDGLYTMDERGAYWYRKGYNPRS